MYTNDTNFVSSGLGAGGYGAGFGGGSGIWAILLLALLGGRRGFGDGFGGGDCDSKQLVVDAINGRVDAVKEIASHLHTTVENVQMALCDVKAKVEAHGVAIDCVKENVRDLHSDFRGFQREFCDFKADTRVAAKDLEIRALIDKAEVLKKIENVEDRVAKEFCNLRSEQKDEIIRQLRCDNDRKDRYADNNTVINNFGTILDAFKKEISTALNSVQANS